MRIAPRVNLRRSGIGIPLGGSLLFRLLPVQKEKDPPACGREVILFGGSLFQVSHQNLPLFLQAFAKLLSSHPLHVVGEAANLLVFKANLSTPLLQVG